MSDVTLVEGFDADAIALARLLAAEGARRRWPAPGAAPPDALALRSLGVEVREHADLDSDPGEHDEAFLDVWTPEVAPRVARLRASGCRVRCLGDLVLERASVPTIGITGTAGKTTTAAFLVELLRKAGLRVAASTTARAGNLWPTAELLDAPDADVVVLELTSSHLCFTTHSPTVAVVTSLLARPPRAPRVARALPRRKGGDRPQPVGDRRGRGERGRRGRRRDRRPLTRSTARVLAVARGRGGRLPPRRGARAPRRRTGSASSRYRPGSTTRASRRCSARSRPRSPSARARGDRAAPAAAVPHGRRRPARRYRARRRRDVGDADEDRRRASPAQRWIGRARRRRRARERRLARPRIAARSNDCSRTRARRHAVPLASSSSSAPRRNGSRRCSTPTGRSSATSLEDAIARAGAHAGGAETLLVSPMFPLPLAARESIAGLLRALVDSRE